MVGEPTLDLRVLVRGVVVEDRVDHLAGRHRGLEALGTDEILMPVVRHAAADNLAFEHVEGGKQRRRAIALVVVGHRAARFREPLLPAPHRRPADPATVRTGSLSADNRTIRAR